MTRLSLADIEIDSQITPQQATITIRLRESASRQFGLEHSLVWSGRIRGPFCVFSQTLAANYPLRASKTASEAIATIPDFCHWSADLPFTYELHFELKSGDQTVANFQETIAVHWIRLHQGKIYQAAKRWVPRLAKLGVVEPSQLNAWLMELRRHELALIIREAEATDDLLRECQAFGTPVAIELAPETVDASSNLESYACVFLVKVARETAVPVRTRLLVASYDEELAEVSAARWKLRRGNEHLQQGPSGHFAVRTAAHTSPVDARAACDQLQADTAHLGEWAAYLA